MYIYFWIFFFSCKKNIPHLIILLLRYFSTYSALQLCSLPLRGKSFSISCWQLSASLITALVSCRVVSCRVAKLNFAINLKCLTANILLECWKWASLAIDVGFLVLELNSTHTQFVSDSQTTNYVLCNKRFTFFCLSSYTWKKANKNVR
jgi:hypothetical protein